MHAILCIEHRQKKSYAMHTIKITPNFLSECQCTSGKFIRLPNRIQSNRNFFGRIGMLYLLDDIAAAAGGGGGGDVLGRLIGCAALCRDMMTGCVSRST